MGLWVQWHTDLFVSVLAVLLIVTDWRFVLHALGMVFRAELVFRGWYSLLDSAAAIYKVLSSAEWIGP